VGLIIDWLEEGGGDIHERELNLGKRLRDVEKKYEEVGAACCGVRPKG